MTNPILPTNILNELRRIADRPCCPQSEYPPPAQTNPPEIGSDAASGPGNADLCRAGALYLNVLDNWFSQVALPTALFEFGVGLGLTMVGQPGWLKRAIVNLATMALTGTPVVGNMHQWLLDNRTGLLSDITNSTSAQTAKTAIDTRIDGSSLPAVERDFLKVLFGAGSPTGPTPNPAGLVSVFALDFDVFPDSDITWAGCTLPTANIFFKAFAGRVYIGRMDTFEQIPGRWLLYDIARRIWFETPADNGGTLDITADKIGGTNDPISCTALLGDGTTQAMGDIDFSLVPEAFIGFGSYMSPVIGIELHSMGQHISISSMYVDGTILS